MAELLDRNRRAVENHILAYVPLPDPGCGSSKKAPLDLRSRAARLGLARSAGGLFSQLGPQAERSAHLDRFRGVLQAPTMRYYDCGIESILSGGSQMIHPATTFACSPDCAQ